MGVAVDQAGEDEGAFQIDLDRLGSAELGDFSLAAHRDDASVPDGDGFGARGRRVHRVDLSADQHQIGRLPLYARLQGDDDRGGTDGQQKNRVPHCPLPEKMNGSATQDNAGRSRGSTRRLFLDAARLFLDIRRGARTCKRKDEGQGMKFELLTELSPEEVIRRADEYYKQHTGLNVDERADEVLELSGAIGTAKVTAHRDHGGHTTVYVETDRGVGFDVTDQTLRFLYSLPHV